MTARSRRSFASLPPMAFDPTAVPEDGSHKGHLDDTPIYEILLGLLQGQGTGRLTIPGPNGDNHMFFMNGRPVGVQLAEYFHPLGQLLLELGRIDAHTFIKAQRFITEGNRLPGQVFMNLGVLTEQGLADILAVQANRKAEEFCRIGGRPFSFGRGLTFLSGFQSTPLDVHAVLFLAVRQQMGPASRTNWLEELSDKELKLNGEGDLLPSPLETYGFGKPEQRFLERLRSGWQPTKLLSDTGTLPDDEMAVLLRYLHIIGRVQMRVRQTAAPPPAPAEEAEVFGTSPRPLTGDAPRRRRTPERAADDLHNLPKEPPPRERPPSPPPRKKQPPKKSDSIVVAPELMDAGKKKKKRKKRRAEPLPSEGTAAESETKKEKTNISPLPTIMIDPE